MPYAERTNPANRTPNHRKATSLPMPIAAYHNNEQKHISTANSFLRRKCLEYFADTATGEIGLRCTFCRDLSEEDRAELRSFVFPRQIVGIHAAVVTLQYSHLPYCTEVPEEVLEHLDVLKENDLIVAERNKDKGGSNNSSGGISSNYKSSTTEDYDALIAGEVEGPSSLSSSVGGPKFFSFERYGLKVKEVLVAASVLHQG